MLEKSYIDKICEYHIFDAHWYCTKYPDIKQGNLDPFKHFIQYGIYEKRFPNRNFRINLSELSNKLQNPVLEYIIYLCDNAISLSSICPLSNDKLKLLFDQATKLSLFNYNWYLEKYVDVYLTPNLHPFEHYMNIGWCEGRNPSSAFNTEKYLETYRNREKITDNPLKHFLEVGLNAGLQYWPTDDYRYSENKKKLIVVENSHDRATMHYRAKEILNDPKNKDEITILKINSNSIDHSNPVHDVYAIVLVRTTQNSQHIASLMNRAKNFSVPVIYDIDDFIWDEAELDNLRSFYRRQPEEKEHFKSVMRQVRGFMTNANAIVTSTWPLKILASKFGKPVQVVPNSIKKNRLALDKRYEKKLKRHEADATRMDSIVLGYFSGTSTHEYDFLECLEAVCDLLRIRNNVILRLVGEIPVKPAYFEGLSAQVEYLPLLAYEEMLSEISKCDIILAPLETGNIFCDCKSELKLFEPALFSIPVVCSPSFTYASTIMDGINGFLAGSKDEWREKLLQLIDNEPFRRTMGENAYTTILPRFETRTAFSIYKNFVLHIREILQRTGEASRYQAPTPGKSKAEPRISLVTCVYNKSRELPEFLRSIEEQMFDQCAEIVFVDDHSTDNSIQIIQNWIKYLHYSPFNDWIKPKLLTTTANSGNCVGRNVGIRAAKADIVTVVDCDCVLSENYLREHCNAHSTGCGDVCVGSRGIETQGNPASVVASNYTFNPAAAVRDSRHQDFFLINHFVNCVTRNFSFNKIKFPLLFKEEFTYTLEKESGFGWEDVDFGCRLFTAGAWIVYLERCFTLHITHESLCDDKEKALKSLRNFYKLLSLNPFLIDEQTGWFSTTFSAIRSWLLKYNYDVSQMKEYRELNHKRQRSKGPGPLFRTKGKRLRILSHAWHAPHQYELCKTQHDFFYIYDRKPNWNYKYRPFPHNATFVNLNEVNPNDYDLMIGHFDENVLHPEYCNGIVPQSWGQLFLFLASMRDTLPMICVCHGTPQFYGQYDPYRNPDKPIAIVEESRAELIDFLGSTQVVVNSHQAREEWKFVNAMTIWHGFQSNEFMPISKKNLWLCMEAEKMRQRPIYNGFTLFKECMLKAPCNMVIRNMRIDDTFIPFAPQLDSLLWAKTLFARYRKVVAESWFYLNFTQRSPMPRSRGESMMCGVIPVTTRNHDADMFIKHGDNGFLFDNADEFTETIEYILRNELKWEKWSKRARETARQTFHLDRYLQEWLGLMKKYA